MPARDAYHDTMRAALVKDGWTITHDPFKLKVGRKDLFIDLGAERLLAAERSGQRIAVEIKSFGSRSDVADLENALGQFILYNDLLATREPDRTLYLAIPRHAWDELFEEPIGQVLLANRRVRLIVFDVSEQVILKWIS